MPSGEYYCDQLKKCEPTVTRSWGGLPANSALEFCVVYPGETLCLQDPPTAGGGSGQDQRAALSMDCGSALSYQIESVDCGLTATAQASCSMCVESSE